MTAHDRSKQVPDAVAASMQGLERDRIATFLQATVSAGACSQDVAGVIADTFRSIDGLLAPIIGQRGMAALYERSMHLARPAHPWLPSLSEGARAAIDLAPLTAVLAEQSAADAAAAGIVVLQTFHRLLTTLIGDSLTERLLRPVWATFLSGPPARDTMS